MNKFELSLWHDSFLSYTIDSYNKANPGEGYDFIISNSELIKDNNYYVWNDKGYWEFPMTFIKEDSEKNYAIFTDKTGKEYNIINNSDNILLQNPKMQEEKIQILANEQMEYFQGKICNIILNSKLDGTHTLSFEAPTYFYNFFTNQRELNDYLNKIKLKSKIKLYYKNQWFTFIINNKTQKVSKKGNYYEFEANDLALEELSKNGYTIVLDDNEDNLEYLGVGTAIELANKVLQGTDWQVNTQLTTANFQEFKEETIYNIDTEQYEVNKVPVVTYKPHFSQYLNDFVYYTNFYYNPSTSLSEQKDFYNIKVTQDEITTKETSYPIYCIEEPVTTEAGSIKNIIASNSDFVSLESWKMTDEDGKASLTNFYPIKKEDGHYNLIIGQNKKWLTTSNFTEKAIKSQRYVLHIKGKSQQPYNIKMLSNTKVAFHKENLELNNYYIIYPDKNLLNGEISFQFGKNSEIEEIELFPLNIRELNSHKELAPTVENLKLYNTSKYLSYNCCSRIDLTIDKELNRGILSNTNNDIQSYILLPNSIVNSTVLIKNKYFIEPFNDIKEAIKQVNNFITKLDENLIIEIDENFLLQKIKNQNIIKEYNYQKDEVFYEENITESAKEYYEKGIIVYNNRYKQKEYYISTKINYRGKNFYKWKKALLKYNDEKIRQLKKSKSNRYSLLQDIAERFEVYVQFSTMQDPVTGKILYRNNKPIKEIYFVDQIGEQKWNGFKTTINLESIDRKVISNELVTKMYVENIEADHSKNGLVSIKLSNLNDTKEEFLYNFRHFLNTGALDNSFIQEFDNYKILLRSINDRLLNSQEKLNKLTESVIKNKTYVENLEMSLDNLREQIKQNKDQSVDIGNYYLLENYYDINNLLKDYYSQNGLYYQDKKLYLTDDINTNYSISYNGQNSDMHVGDIVLLEEDKIINGKHYYVFADYDYAYYKGEKFRETDLTINNFFKQDSLNKLIYKDQKEIFILNDILPLEKKTYFKLINNKYYKVDTPLESEKNIYYQRFLTTNNIQWVKANTKWSDSPNIQWYIQYNLNNQLQPEIRTFEDYYMYLEKPNNEKINLTTVLEHAGFIDNGPSEILKLQNLEELNHKKQAIQELINQEEKLFNLIQQGKIAYQIDKIEYDQLTIKINNLLHTKKNLINNFENKYIQFIKEGTWSDTNYSNNDSYYLDALCVSNRSSLPKVEYNIQVIDLSSKKEFQEYDFQVGDETFAIDKEIFGIDKNNTPIKEKIIITELTEQLDNPAKNTITIRNYTDRFEDLFERISASVTAVEKNEETWDKANILNQNGSISSELLTDINTANTQLVNSSIGLKNNYKLNNEGLSFINLIDDNYQTKFNSLGLFLTESANKNGNWTTAISAKGINASAINTGRLKTNKITIVSEFAPSQTWSSLGISCYSDKGSTEHPLIDNSTFTRLDKFGLYLIQNKNNFGLINNNPWFLGKTENECLDQIQKDGVVSITKRGFRYNSSLGQGKIGIGILDYQNNSEGIEFINNNEQTLFKVATTQNGYIAQLAGWNFNDSSLWRQLKITGNAHYDLNQAYYNNQNLEAPFIINDFGIGMKNIALQTNGQLWCRDIVLEGGRIDGEVKINDATMGPFRFRGKKNNSDFMQYMYAEYLNNGEFATNKDNGTEWNTNFTYDEQSWRVAGRRDSFYLGNALFTTKLQNWAVGHNDGRDHDGILLSIGSNLVVHSSGYTRIGGDNGHIYIGGRSVYIDGACIDASRIDASQINVDDLNVQRINGQDVVNMLRDGYKGDVVNIVNEYLTNNRHGNLGCHNNDKGCQFLCACPVHSAYYFDKHEITPNKDTPVNWMSNAPCIEFQYGNDYRYIVSAYVDVVPGYEFYSLCQVYQVTIDNTMEWVCTII